MEYRPLCNTKVKGEFREMQKYFSIGEAAKAVRTTTETRRHYARIGLVKPSKKDEWTKYRYYTEQDRCLLLLAVQVHHAVCDGYHACRFLSILQDGIGSM